MTDEDTEMQYERNLCNDICDAVHNAQLLGFSKRQQTWALARSYGMTPTVALQYELIREMLLRWELRKYCE